MSKYRLGGNLNERIVSYNGKSSATFMTAQPAMAVYNEADIVVYIGRTQHNLNLALTNAVEISGY